MYGSCEDTIYYNVVIPHNNETQDYTVVQYNKLNTTPIVNKPNDYLLTVNRFSIPTRGIPILVVEPLEGQPNKLIYSVTLSSSNGTFEVTNNIDYYSTTVGIAPSNFLYYYVYTYSHMIKMINDTLKLTMTQLKALDGTIPVEAEAPQFLFNPVTQLLSVVAQSIYYRDDIVVNKINFYSNQYLFKLFDSIIVDYLTTSLLVDKAVRYAFFDKGDNLWEIDNTYLIMTSDYSIISNWSSLQSIELEISSVPVNYEYIDHDYKNPNKETTSAPVLKDYIVLYRDVNQSVARTTIDYTSLEDSWICLQGIEPIRQIGIGIFWVSKTGKRNRLTLSNGEVASIKLQFKRKDLTF